MALESATHIQDFVTANPTGSDQKAQGDDHIRMIKEVLKRDFPDVTGITRLLGWNAKTDAVVAKTAGYTLSATDDGKMFDFTIASGQTLSFPSATLVANNGFVAWVKKDSSENLLTVASTGAETINGLASIQLGANDSGMLWCDGANWHYLGTSITQWTEERRVRRSANDATLQDGAIYERTRSGTAANNDFGVAVAVAKHQDAAGNLDTVGRFGWRMLDTGNGSEDMAWFWENIIAGAIASTDRLWKGQGLFADGLVDQGAKTLNFLKLYMNDDQVLPLGDLPQLAVADIALADRILIRDTSAADHMWAAPKDVGGWCVLSEQIASASATLDFVLTTFLTNFEDFEFIITGIVPTTDNTNLLMRFSSDGGATYDAGAGNYRFTNLGETEAALVTNISASATALEINNSTLGNNTDEEFHANVMLRNPASMTKRTLASWTTGSLTSAGTMTTSHGSGCRTTPQDTDAVRFLMSSSTLASGKITLMGRRKAA